MNNKLNMISKIYNAYQLQGNINDLLIRLETTIDENINDTVKLSEIIQNIPGGNLVHILKADSSLISTS